MHYKIKNTQLGKLISQRNNAMLIIAGLFVLCGIQSITIYHMINRQKINFTPLPNVVTQPFSISKDGVSEGYLAEMTRYFAMLRLNYTPATIQDQAQWLLRYTDGIYYGVFKEQLAKEIEKAKAHDISLSFSPVDTRVDLRTLAVWIDGDLVETVGKMRIEPKRVTYKINYYYQNGQLRVVSMTEVSGEKHE